MIMKDKKFEEEFEKVKNYVIKYAAKEGFDLNPDENIVNLVIEGLVRNKLKYKKQYCPCRIVSGDPEEDRPKICPCKWHKEEIERDGHCHCLLFFKKK